MRAALSNNIEGNSKYDIMSDVETGLIFQEFHPKTEISKYVKSIFYFDFTSESLQTRRFKFPKFIGSDISERLIPSGCCDLIIQSHHGFSMSASELKQKVVLPKTFVAPIMTRPVKLIQLENVKVFGVRLWPWATKCFLKKNNQYSGFDILDASNFFANDSGVNFYEKLFACDLQTSILHIENWANGYLEMNGTIDEIVKTAIQLILESKGLIELDKIFSKCNITTRRIEQRFIDCVGMSPKQYSRLAKFQNIFRSMNEGKIDSLMDIVHECGYYDQSHLIRNFREFSGTTPKQYFKELNYISTFLTTKKSISFLLNDN